MASDLFSFGVMLYEMLTGQLPYGGDTAFTRIMARVNQRPPLPRAVRQEVPEYLEKVVMRCLERDAALRYQSVSEVLADLDRRQVNYTLGASLLRARRSVARNRSATVAVVAVVLLVAGAAWVLLRGDRPASSGGAEVAPVTRLGILPLTNATGAADKEWMRTGLPEMIVTDMAQSQYLRPVATERILAVLHRLGMDQQTRFDEAALERITAEAKVDALLYGQFLEAAGKLRLDLTLRKQGSGVPTPLKIEGAPEDVFALVDRITGEIRENTELGRDVLLAEDDRPVSDVMTSSVDALRSYNEGIDRLRRGDNQEAIAALTKATATDATFAVAWAKLGDAYLNAGRDQDAVEVVDRASALAEQQKLPLTERYLIHATAARLRDDYETAAKSYLELAALDPDDAHTHTSLAQIYEEMGRFQEAADAYAKALELAPDSTEALFGLSWARLSTGNPRESMRLLEKPLQSGELEGNAEALGMLHSILGVAYREMADFDQARAHLEKSYDYRVEAGDYRGQHTSLDNLSQLFSNLGQTDLALEAQQKALALARQIGDREGESNVLFDMGETYKMAHRLDDALSALRDSMQIEREREDEANLALRLTSIGDVYRQKGQYDDALVYFEQARGLIDRTRQAGDAAANLIYISMARKEQGLYAEAIEALLESLSLSEPSEDAMAVASAHRLLGEIYRDQGRYQDAFAAMTKSMDFFTRIHAAHDIAELKPIIGGLLVRVGLLEQAEKELTEAAGLARHEHADAPMPEVLLARGELAFLRGDPRSAAADYREADKQATHSQKWEVAIRSRVALAQLQLGGGPGSAKSGNRADALKLLERALAQAKETRLRPVEAEAEAGLAQARLALGDAAAALEHAQRAVAIAKKLETRPTLYRAYAVKGEAERSLGRAQDATQSFVEAANVLRWVRGSLDPKHVDSFIARTDVQALVGSTADRLAEGGQAELAAELKGWTAARAAASSSS